MPPLDPLTTTWAGLPPGWWAVLAGLVVLGLWGSSRRDAERRRAAQAGQDQRPPQRSADLPQAAPGEWRVRCTHCQGTAAARAMGILRLGAVGRKFLLGRCPDCRRLRWLSLERASLRGVGSTPRPRR